MQSTTIIFGFLVLFSSAMATYHSSTKLRRDSVLKLYPFPRVGRASRNTWQVPLNDYFMDYEPVEKRQLYAFPRVGRSGLMMQDPLHQEYQVSGRRTDGPAMWFGPRLGRGLKTEEDDNTIQNEKIDHSEPEQMESLSEESEKRELQLL